MTQAIIEELDLRRGDHYDQFEILAVLGRGSYARVFAARHPSFGDRVVALKISRVPLDSEITAIRALREIRALQSLHNPHVVHILDHGMGSDERWYMVMELLEGSTLLELHDFDYPMLPERAFSLVYQACVGLDEAHRQGIVHRDVKPENLWICRSKAGPSRGSRDLLKVIDFGLARAWDPSVTVGEQATVGHMLIGTPHYAQPEQVESGVLTPASDVYSLGVVLYELLTGRVPYFPDEPWASVVLRLSHKPIRWLGAHVKKELVPLERHPQGRAISDEARAVVHAMLMKDPEQRPATGGVAARMLAEILHEEYAILVAATLDLEHCSEIVVPGSHTIGEQTGTIALKGIGGAAARGEARVIAKLDWLGPGTEATLTPVEAGMCSVNGQVLAGPVQLAAGARIELGALSMRMHYPRS
ncbi:Serine/threonine-protein kinase PknB [Enhygromyxa salina]|uniref:Serine/threonine-protein kinase PknB n=1 Tax=Enhygromyxa salina TaxID=215803 RepID=A0A2S9Y2V5_9BACT|nr:serine/threonine-protein kinase [Enhygromyxa salina]PRP99371.1 Serine/threonine-protein kinase PknB [Enhygromyxa salina]